MKFGNGINLQGSELQNATVQNLASAPSSPKNGQIYVDTSTTPNKFYIYLSGQMRDLVDIARVIAVSLDQFAAPVNDLNINAKKITNVADPSSAQDVATKSYVDNFANGSDWKNSVKAATTANITLSGTQTIDDISLIAGDRVLVKDQSTGSQNGIYVVAAGAWSRAVDADSSIKITAGMSVFVSEGTVNGDTQWKLVTNDSIILNTTALSFSQTGSSTSYSQGTGIGISGNIISIDSSVVVRKYAQDIGDGSTTSIAVSHNLNTLDIKVAVYLKSTGEEVLVDNIRTSVNVVTLIFSTAPTSNQYRIVVQG